MMKNKAWLQTKNILVLLLGITTVYLIVSTVIDGRFNNIDNKARELVSAQQSKLAAIAEATARGGADTVTESIVRDCALSERGEFDDLLSRLNSGLSSYELKRLEVLFGRCGSFYSQRKLVMSARFEREVEVYTSYVELMEAIEDKDLKNEFSVSDWAELVVKEKQQAKLFSDLVSSQEKIISLLLDGKSTRSEEFKSVLREAKNIQDQLFVANQQAANLRSSLVSL